MSTFIASAITDCLDNIAARRALCDALVARGWRCYQGDENPNHIHLSSGDYVCSVARDASVRVLHAPSATCGRAATVATIHRPQARTWRAQMVRAVGAAVAAHDGGRS